MFNFLFTWTPLRFMIQNLWRDEAFTYLLAKKNIGEILLLTAKDFNPPLYYLLVHVWITICGGSEISLRVPSLLFFSGTIYISYLFMKDVLKVKGVWIYLYLFLFILNPLLVYYAFEARMYSMLAFLALASSYTFFTNKKKTYLLSTILGLYTHYFMVFVLLTQAIIFLSLKFHKRKHEKIIPFQYFLYSLAAFIPWIVFLLLHKSTDSFSTWITSPILSDIFHVFGILYTGYETDFHFLSFGSSTFIPFLVASSALLLTICAGELYLYIERNKKKEHHDILPYLLTASVLLPFFIFIIAFIHPLFLPRYLIYSTPLFLLLLVYLLHHHPPLLKIIFFAGLIYIALHYQILQTTYRTKADIKKVLQEIKYLAHDNDILYVENELDYFLGEYYFQEDKVFIYNKTYEELRFYIGKILIPKDHVTSALPSYPQRAFVLRQNGTYQILSAY
ncbi:MAG: glycosyltransferase family 39 protein [bacterium]|nr:glycosyltransferase family 39 protein [bacterium]